MLSEVNVKLLLQNLKQLVLVVNIVMMLLLLKLILLLLNAAHGDDGEVSKAHAGVF